MNRKGKSRAKAVKYTLIDFTKAAPGILMYIEMGGGEPIPGGSWPVMRVFLKAAANGPDGLLRPNAMRDFCPTFFRHEQMFEVYEKFLPGITPANLDRIWRKVNILRREYAAKA